MNTYLTSRFILLCCVFVWLLLPFSVGAQINAIKGTHIFIGENVSLNAEIKEIEPTSKTILYVSPKTTVVGLELLNIASEINPLEEVLVQSEPQPNKPKQAVVKAKIEEKKNPTHLEEKVSFVRKTTTSDSSLISDGRISYLINLPSSDNKKTSTETEILRVFFNFRFSDSKIQQTLCLNLESFNSLPLYRGPPFV